MSVSTYAGASASSSRPLGLADAQVQAVLKINESFASQIFSRNSSRVTSLARDEKPSNTKILVPLEDAANGMA